MLGTRTCLQLREWKRGHAVGNPGLLPPRLYCVSAPENGGAGSLDSNKRRPADVYLPRWRRGGPAAVDFAVTSGLSHNNVAKIQDRKNNTAITYVSFEEVFDILCRLYRAYLYFSKLRAYIYIYMSIIIEHQIFEHNL